MQTLYDEIEKSVKAGVMEANPYKDKGFVPGDYSKANYEKIDLHRPYVDDIVLVSSTGKPMHRELDLIDVWFDSGAMPYAQIHYPFENKEGLDSGDLYAGGCSAYKPAVERIIKHGLVGTPTMRIVVHMLLYPERFTGLLHLYGYDHIKILGLLGGLVIILAVDVKTRVVSIFDIIAFMTPVQLHIDAVLNKRLGAVIEEIILSGKIHPVIRRYLTVLWPSMRPPTL